MMQIEKKFTLGAIIVLLIMLSTAILPFQISLWAHSSQNALHASQQRIDSLTKLLSLMKDAETGQRGFVITGKEPFLAPYHNATGQLGQIREELQLQASTSTELSQVLHKIFQLVDLKMEELSDTIELRRSDGFGAVEPIVTSARGKAYMDELRQIINAYNLGENRSVSALQAELERRANIAVYAGLGVALFNFILLAILRAGLRPSTITYLSLPPRYSLAF